MRALDYYFWINSDWAYLGIDRLLKIAANHDILIVYKPVDLLQIYRRTGGIPLHQRSRERQLYREQELRRWIAVLDLPINITPRYMCPDSTLASCFVIAAMEQGEPVAELHKRILAAQWCGERDISSPDVLMDVASGLGMAAEAIMANARSPEVRETLQKYTDQAVDCGVFGSPSYVFEGELFWGQDRLEMLEDKIRMRLNEK